MLYLKNNLWWLLAARGIFAILLGVLAFIGSAQLSSALVETFAIFTLVWGILMVVNGEVVKSKMKNWWLSSLEGLIELFIGTVILSFPEYEFRLFYLFIPVWAQFVGILQMIMAFENDSFRIRNEIPVLVGGVVCIILGLLFLSDFLIEFPVTVKVGSLTVTVGLILVLIAVKLRKRHDEWRHGTYSIN
jgi:uncharacterized membrane protein HdeD (DUF308 family)